MNDCRSGVSPVNISDSDTETDHPGTNFMSLLRFFTAVCVPCFLESFVQKLLGKSDRTVLNVD